MEHQEQIILTHNFLDTFFYCRVTESRIIEQRIPTHMLAYIISGEMKLEIDDESAVFGKGSAVFVKRNHLMKKTKQALSTSEPFIGMFLHLHSGFLKQLLTQLKRKSEFQETVTQGDMVNFLQVPKHAFIDGFFMSLEKYFNAEDYPSKELMENKLKEIIMVLSQIAPTIIKHLFDFSSPWKIDLVDFMEKNFTNELTLEEFANYTGRSLSAFKRDFDRAFSCPPGQWLVKRRLQMAHEEITQSSTQEISEICYKVGFKNLSHFSKAFKATYGIPPTQLERKAI